MSLPALDNLVRIGQLKAEPRNEAEATRMLAMARTRLAAELCALVEELIADVAALVDTSRA